MNKTWFLRGFLFVLGGIMLLGLFGCSTKRYSVDYSGEKEAYTGAKDSYRAGEKVTLYYNIIDTDTDYTFYMDDEEIRAWFDYKKGFKLSFTMPEHDIRLAVSRERTMYYSQDEDPEPVEDAQVEEMLLDYYTAAAAADGDGGHYEIVLYTSAEPELLRLTVYKQEEDEAETSVSYLVPCEVFDRCMEVIRDSGMRSWNDLDDTESLDGVRIVCKFKDGDEYIRVTSDQIPADGEKAFDEIRGILQEYIQEKYKE